MNTLKEPRPYLQPPSPLDFDVLERVVRALQWSELQVFAACCMCSDPNFPNDPRRFTSLNLACISDGRHGFLVLCDDFAPPKSDMELREFMHEVAGSPDSAGYVALAARIHPPEESPTPGVLDLSHGPSVQAMIEAEYEKRVRSKSLTARDDFFACFETCGAVSDEAECVRRMLDLDAIG